MPEGRSPEPRRDAWAQLAAAASLPSQDPGLEPPEAPGGWFRRSRHVVVAGDNAQRRIFVTYVKARAALGLALVLMQAGQMLAGNRALTASAVLCVAYAVQAALCWLWPGYRAGDGGRISIRQWWFTVGMDALVFGTLHWLDAYTSLNYAALLVLPVLMAGVLCTWVPALATTAAVALSVLGVAIQRSLAGGEAATLLMQAGLAGTGLFIITLVAGQMASWVAREERTALDSLELAHQQAELNRLVIDEMAEGVLVVDREGRVRVANPAARHLLAEGGACPSAPFSLQTQPGWRSLWLSVERFFDTGHWPPTGTDLTVSFEQQVPRSIRLRLRCTRSISLDTEGEREVLAVAFLEAARSVQERQRQEQLMTMGRLSASIAHEIRNPLAAIAQANALLMEDELRPDQHRLGRIVTDNVERLKRIVADVMDSAPGGGGTSVAMDAVREVELICEDWARTVGLKSGSLSRLKVGLPTDAQGVFFDPEHLRRVLVNLLDNALRHSRDLPGSVCVALEGMEGGFVRLSVGSDGALIAPEVERHLFEPFHSTRSRGAGLGLYICRELCQRHGAIIEYTRHPADRHGNVFAVVMRRADWPDASTLNP